MIANWRSQQPTRSRGATIDQHLRATLRLGKEAIEAFKAQDGRSHVDMDPAAGDVLISRPLQADLHHGLAGHGDKAYTTILEGKLSQGSLEAKIMTSNREIAHLTYSETDSEIRVGVTPGRRPLERHAPGTIFVKQDKLTGEALFRQENNLPFVPANPTTLLLQEATWGPGGPEASEADFYRQGLQDEGKIRAAMQQTMQLDGSEQDLNSEPGVVVVAGQKSLGLVDGRIGLEASVSFDPSSGQIQNFEAGFGHLQALTYQREGEKEIFETVRSCDPESRHGISRTRLELSSDGSRLQQKWEPPSSFAPIKAPFAARISV
jgi:hypothetical protein